MHAYSSKVFFTAKSVFLCDEIFIDRLISSVFFWKFTEMGSMIEHWSSIRRYYL